LFETFTTLFCLYIRKNKTHKRVSSKSNTLNLNGIDYSSVSIQPLSIRKLIKVTRLASSKSQFVQSDFTLLLLRSSSKRNSCI